MIVISMLVRLRQEDWEFETSLASIVRTYLNKTEKGTESTSFLHLSV